MPLRLYHAEHCTFSLAFFERDGRELLVHATAWNRLEITDPRTGENLVARPDQRHIAARTTQRDPW